MNKLSQKLVGMRIVVEMKVRRAQTFTADINGNKLSQKPKDRCQQCENVQAFCLRVFILIIDPKEAIQNADKILVERFFIPLRSKKKKAKREMT